MYWYLILLVTIGISCLAQSSPPKIPFQQLLETCTNPEYSNSTQCRYFFSTYPWRNDDVQLVFQKLRSMNRTLGSIAWKSLEERLIHLIGIPNFDLTSLGKRSFYSSVANKNEPLAIAIWPQLEKYKNHSTDFYFFDSRNLYSDLQFFECDRSMYYIVNGNMLHLLKKMLTDQPDCLLQDFRTIEYALSSGCSREMRELLVDHGLELLPMHFQSRFLSPEGFEWALLNYRHSNVLINNSIRNGSEILAISVWEFLKQKNYNDMLFQICNNNVFDVVKANKVELLKSMLSDCPDCIHSNGNTLMAIAVKGGQRSLPMIQLLNFYGVEIPSTFCQKVPALESPGNLAFFDYEKSISREGWSLNTAYEYFLMAVEKIRIELQKIQTLRRKNH